MFVGFLNNLVYDWFSDKINFVNKLRFLFLFLFVEFVLKFAQNIFNDKTYT